MNLTLAINTASRDNAMALIENGKVIGEQAWQSQANQSTMVLPSAVQLLEQENRAWKDLEQIFVVKGPGSYTSLRVGITIANTLAWVLKISLVSTDVFEVWEHRLPPETREREHTLAIAAGKDHYLLKGEVQRRTKEEMSAMEGDCYGEFSNDSNVKLFSFGEAVSEILAQGLAPVKQVEPLYLHPPHITTKKS